MKKSTYEKIGRAVVKGTVGLGLTVTYVSIFMIWFMRG